MQAVLYNVPTMIVVCVVAAMMVTILQFDQLRGTGLKNLLIRLWPADRRRVLHLDKQNGFHFLVECLIDWSDILARLAWIPALSAFAGGPRAVLFAGFFISLGFLVRYSSLLYLAAIKIARFTGSLEYDGFGVYARTADDWRAVQRRIRLPFSLSIVATILFLIPALTWR